jgi:hypothetical protein
MSTYPNYMEFVQALRKQMDKPFNFIVPKVPQGTPPQIDICARWNDQPHWVRFPLILTDDQLDFIAWCFVG